MVDKNQRNCGDCKFSVRQDYGYSNWTVEGTNFSCLKDLHPDREFDFFYGEPDQLKYASSCQSYVFGAGLSIDCDNDDGWWGNYTVDPEVKQFIPITITFGHRFYLVKWDPALNSFSGEK